MNSIILCSLLSLTASGPAGGELRDPEFEGEVHLLSSDQATFTPLERASATQSMKLRGLGVGGVKTVYTVPGARSPTRVTTEPQAFVVRVARQSADPSSTIELYGLAVDGNKRKINYSSVSVFGVKEQAAQHKIGLEFAKFATTSVRIQTPPLARGEYCFNTGGSAPVSGPTTRTVWCFGVD